VNGAYACMFVCICQYCVYVSLEVDFAYLYVQEELVWNNREIFV
jgi:hypothetical protein